ncbi:MAG: cupredoxin domain-containing protein [Parcubacteria group bacterium]
MNNKIIAVIVILILIVAGFLMFRGESNAPVLPGITTENNSNTSEETETTTPNDVDEAEVKSFVVTGTNFRFNPSSIAVKKGDTVQLTFINSAGIHDLRIDEFKVATKNLSSGQSETVTFVANKTGTFEYYCSVGNHREMGMIGILTVTE